MGVYNLWAELAKYDSVVQSLSGQPRRNHATQELQDDNAAIVAQMQDKVLAVDTSVWLFQASQQRDASEGIQNEDARVLYIFIFRIMNLLRYGVTPVFVLEGDTPQAKFGRLHERSAVRGSTWVSGNRRGGHHDRLGRTVAQLLEHLGVPYVQAPGEAEAMCAVLNAQGLADGCITTDVDALMFGAQVIYKECRLFMGNPKDNCVERIDAKQVASACFGLQGAHAGCSAALQAVANLCGCDYNVDGGKGVGVTGAVETVQVLTDGKQDDSSVLEELLAALEQGPDPRIAALKTCSGCKTCGHERHGRGPCSVCGPGQCRPKGSASPCECEFHRLDKQRKFTRYIARATSSPRYVADLRASLAAFKQELSRASAEARTVRQRLQGGRFSWSKRPNAQGIFALLHPLLGGTSSDPNKVLWTYPDVRDKMRPVLMEWDMRQGPQPASAAAAAVEFRPCRISKVAGKAGATNSWAYLVEFERLDMVNGADAEFDRQQLGSKLAKDRHVRMCLLDTLWPHLLDQYEAEAEAKQNSKSRKGSRSKVCDSSPGGTTGSGGRRANSTAAAVGRGQVGPAMAAPGGGAVQPQPSASDSGSIDRFLHRYGGPAVRDTAPAASGRQGGAGAGTSYGAYPGQGAAAAGAAGGYGGSSRGAWNGGYPDDEDGGDDWVMTQRSAPAAQAAAQAATGPPQPQAQARPRQPAQWKPLFEEDEDAFDGYDEGGGTTAEPATMAAASGLPGAWPSANAGAPTAAFGSSQQQRRAMAAPLGHEAPGQQRRRVVDLRPEEVDIVDLADSPGPARWPSTKPAGAGLALGSATKAPGSGAVISARALPGQGLDVAGAGVSSGPGRATSNGQLTAARSLFGSVAPNGIGPELGLRGAKSSKQQGMDVDTALPSADRPATVRHSLLKKSREAQDEDVDQDQGPSGDAEKPSPAKRRSNSSGAAAAEECVDVRDIAVDLTQDGDSPVPLHRRIAAARAVGRTAPAPDAAIDLTDD